MEKGLYYSFKRLLFQSKNLFYNKENNVPIEAGWQRKTFSGDFSGPVKVTYFSLRTKKNIINNDFC